MINFATGREYDALVCLYGSIVFVRTEQNLRRTLVTFAGHLKPGDVLCPTPWSTREEFNPRIVVDASNDPHVHITRMENVKLKSIGLIEIDIHHQVGREGIVSYHTQSIEIGLFSRQQYTDVIVSAKLELVEYYMGSDVRMGVFVTRKSPNNRSEQS